MYIQILALTLSEPAEAGSLPVAPRDLAFSWADDVMASETTRLCFEGGPPGAFRVPVDVQLARPFDIPASVEAINTSGYPVRFRVATLGARTVVIPTEAADARGDWAPYSAVLDTVIDLGPPDPATADVVLDRWVAALASVVGRPVTLETILNSYGMCEVSGRGKARDLLAAILDCRGDYDVWRFGSSPTGHHLYIRHLFGLDETPVYRPDLPFEEWNRPPREVEAKYPLFPR